MSWQLGALTVLGMALAAGFYWYERARPDARIVAMVATLAALGALGRIAFAPLPNVKPTTDIVLISGYALGAGPGFVVGALAALTSNFFFGQGPWTPWQMAGWGVSGLIGAWLAVLVGGRRVRRWPFAALCAAVGFGFTALQDVGDWVTYSDHSWAALGVYVGKGLGFDAVHAAGCLMFALAFGPAFARSISRFGMRLEVKWRPPASVLPVVMAVALAGGVAVWSLGAQRAQASPGVQAAISYLRGAQNTDGGLGPAPGQPSSALYSGWAALGLASAGIDPAHVSHGGQSLASYLAAGAGSDSDPGSVERTVLALRAAGLGVTDVAGHDLVAALEADIGANGSVSDQVNLTTFAILALRAADAGVPSHTLSWLTAQEDRDGGFNYATGGGASDVDDTGAVLEALATAPAQAPGDRGRAVAFVERNQNDDGGYPAMPGGQSNAQSTAWAVQGLLAAGVSGPHVDRGLDYLDSLMAGDGHIRYSASSDQTPVWVTAQGLMAVERKPLPLAPIAPAPTPHRAGHSRVAARRAGRAAERRDRTARRPAEISPLAWKMLSDEGVAAALALAPVGLG